MTGNYHDRWLDDVILSQNVTAKKSNLTA